MGLIGKRVGHEKIIVAYVTFALVFSLTLIPLLYSEVLWEKRVLVAYGGGDFPVEAGCIEADALSVFMAMIYLSMGVIACLFLVRELEKGSITGYYTILLGMITGIVGVAFSGDLFTLFIYWEAMCICSYALVAFRKETAESIEASYKYLIMSGAGSITVLFALSFLYGSAGTLNISYLSMSLAGTEKKPMGYIALPMLVFGFGLQAGMVPFHTWLPDALTAAPSSVSAILSAGPEKAGIYCLFKVLLIIFAPMRGAWQPTLSIFAVLTIFLVTFQP